MRRLVARPARRLATRPMRRFATRPMRRFAIAALAGCALLAGACDRQKADAPQPTADSGETRRWTVDRGQAGAPLPAASVIGADGAPATLSALRGKPVLVNLWATWCAPCIEELPTLNRLATEVTGNAHVVTLSQDLTQDPAGPRAFLAERGWEAVTAWHDPENAVGLAYGGSLPTTILFDAQGQETSRVIGPLDWYGDEAKALLREAGFAV